MKSVKILLFLFFIIFSAGKATASRFVSLDGFYIPAGLSVSWTKSNPDGEKDYRIGGEASCVYLTHSLVWLGAYTDFTRTIGENEYYYSFGPEFGYAFFGIDAGFFSIRKSGNKGPSGIRGRFMLTAGIISLYVSYGKALYNGEEKYTGFGLLLKFPVWAGD